MLCSVSKAIDPWYYSWYYLYSREPSSIFSRFISCHDRDFSRFSCHCFQIITDLYITFMISFLSCKSFDSDFLNSAISSNRLPPSPSTSLVAILPNHSDLHLSITRSMVDTHDGKQSVTTGSKSLSVYDRHFITCLFTPVCYMLHASPVSSFRTEPPSV